MKGEESDQSDHMIYRLQTHISTVTPVQLRSTFVHRAITVDNGHYNIYKIFAHCSIFSFYILYFWFSTSVKFRVTQVNIC